MVGFMKAFLHLQDYYYGDNSSTNSSCPSAPAKWCTNDTDEYKICVQSPTLIPACIIALILGLYCSSRISKLSGKFPAKWFYHLAFFLYGIMMTSAGILHCFITDHNKLSNILQSTNANSSDFIELLVAVIDVGLTSSIAITFLFCGLCDTNILNPKSIFTHCLLISLYFIVFLLWTLGILNNWNWINPILYTGVIGICGFIYLLTQLCIKSRRRFLPILCVGGLYGGLGLLARTIGADHICKSEGPFWSQYIGPEFIWFLFSDISIAFIFIYIFQANRDAKKKIRKQYYPIDIEKLPEKY